jgi:CBS domain-containing protein
VADLAYPLDRLTTVRADEPLLPAAQKIDGGDVRDGLVVGADGTVVGTLDAGALYRTVEQRQRRTLGFSS